MFDARKYQADFPILQRKVHGDKKLVYLDNAATSQKPKAVIAAIANYYEQHNANVHRGIHQLGDESTQLFHQSRYAIAKFFGADVEELITVRNTTEAINQVAYTWGEEHMSRDDTVLLSEMEHHSNVVPWQVLAKKKHAQVEWLTLNETGEISLEQLETMLKNQRVKLVSLVHVSNALGTVNPLAEVVNIVRRVSPDTKILVDGAQAAAHLPIDFHQLDVDFYVVSAHKMLGPMGIGGLLVKRAILDTLPPFLFGGGMINEVTLAETSFAENLEERFTAGTPDVASLVGWAAACEYLSKVGMKVLAQYDRELVQYALEKLQQLPQLQVIGPLNAEHRVGSVAFLYKGVHAHDVGQILDSEGVAVRSGHHCTMPLHTKFNWPASVRVSFQLYNTTDDIEACIMALAKVKGIFGK